MVVVYFLVFLSNESISTWLSYLAAGLQQFVLLALLIFYWWRNRKAIKADGTVQKGEGTSILRDGSVSSYTSDDDTHREDSVN